MHVGGRGKEQKVCTRQGLLVFCQEDTVALHLASFPFHNQPDNIYLDSQTKLQSKTGRGKLEKHLIENIGSIGLLTPIFSHLRIILLENVCERGVLWSLRVAAGSGTIGLGINKYG